MHILGLHHKHSEEPQLGVIFTLEAFSSETYLKKNPNTTNHFNYNFKSLNCCAGM